jgi:hypothetical protein
MKKKILSLFCLFLMTLSFPLDSLAHQETHDAIEAVFLAEVSASEHPIPIIIEWSDDPVSINFKKAQQGVMFRKNISFDKNDIQERYRLSLMQKQSYLSLQLENKFDATDIQCSFTEALSGIAVSIPGNRLNELASLPNVVKISDNRREMELFRRDAAISTGTSTLWSGRAGSKATGKGILIGIIDTGIDSTHPEFKDKIKGGEDFTSDANFRIDANYHGTHVAGIAAGSGQNNDSKGMAFEADLMVYKVATAQTRGINMAHVLKAIDQSVKDECKVINLSLGYDGNGETSKGNSAMHKMIKNASDAGVFVVSSIGNAGSRGKNISWVAGAPAIIEETFSVAASNDRQTQQLKISNFTSMGITPDGAFKPEISAPGVDIHSAFPRRYGSYYAISGTSMSSPVIAGIAALIKQSKPSWTHSQIKSSLMNTAELIQNDDNGFPVSFTLQGAGQARVDRAINTPAFLEPRALVIQDWEKGYSGQIEIHANNDMSFQPSFELFVDQNEGMPFKITIEPSSIQLKRGERRTLKLNLTPLEEYHGIKRLRYEGILRIDTLHLPLLMYRESVAQENSLAIRNGVSDVQIDVPSLTFSKQHSRPIRVVFSYNTGAEQTFDERNSNSNFGNVKVFLCDKYGSEWSRFPIFELRQATVGYYSFVWDGTLQNNEYIANGDYSFRFDTNAYSNDRVFSNSFAYTDEESPVYAHALLSSPRLAMLGSDVEFSLYWDFYDKAITQFEFMLYFDDKRLQDLELEFHDTPFSSKNPVIRRSSVKLEWESRWSDQYQGQRFKLATFRFSSKGVGPLDFTARCFVGDSMKRSFRVYPILPKLTFSRREFLLADFNNDLTVDIVDKALLSRHLDTLVSAEDAPNAMFDLNQDQRIDNDDLQILQAEFGKKLK